MSYPFCHPDPQALVASRIVLLSAGARLYLQGEVPHKIYIVEQGMITLTRCSPGGDRRVVAICASGSSLCAGTAMLSARHPTTADAVTDTLLRWFDAPDVIHQCGIEPSFSSWIGLMLARESANQLTYTASLALGARQRLMRLLSIVAASGCGTTDGHYVLRIPTALTHRDISEAIWTTRETVTRLLIQLAQDGIVEVDRGALVIPAKSPLHLLVAIRNPVPA